MCTWALNVIANRSLRASGVCAAVACGAILPILAAMRTHAANFAVCQNAIRSLANLCEEPAGRAAVLEERGALPMLLVALNRHAADADVCSRAAKALSKITLLESGTAEILASGAAVPAL